MTTGGRNGLPVVFFLFVCTIRISCCFNRCFHNWVLKGISLIEFPLLLVKVARIKEKRPLCRLRFLFFKSSNCSESLQQTCGICSSRSDMFLNIAHIYPHYRILTTFADQGRNPYLISFLNFICLPVCEDREVFIQKACKSFKNLQAFSFTKLSYLGGIP